MKRLPIILLAIPVTALAMLVIWSAAPGASAQEACGPGDHWVDTCPAGEDLFAKSGALVGISVDGDCTVDLNLVLNGPTTVHRDDGSPHQIDTEIVSMELTGGGVTLSAGTGTPGIDPGVPPTLGAIVEQPADAALADSFFDVFFEVSGVPGGPLYNHAPLKVEAVIDRVPPYNQTYLHRTGICIPLFTQPSGGLDSGMRLVDAQHDTGPGPTPTPTPTPRPTKVGGVAQDLPEVAGAPLEAPDSSGGGGGALVGLIALVTAGAVALGGTGWYVRRRQSR